MSTTPRTFLKMPECTKHFKIHCLHFRLRHTDRSYSQWHTWHAYYSNYSSCLKKTFLRSALFCVITLKSADLVHFAAAAWNHVQNFVTLRLTQLVTRDSETVHSQFADAISCAFNTWLDILSQRRFAHVLCSQSFSDISFLPNNLRGWPLGK